MKEVAGGEALGPDRAPTVKSQSNTVDNSVVCLCAVAGGAAARILGPRRAQRLPSQ